ncbi:MAG: hypothetical protein K2H48_00120 [Duncaniella sp.]|nr:hypothetical protein [Duncaniella sp.]
MLCSCDDNDEISGLIFQALSEAAADEAMFDRFTYAGSDRYYSEIRSTAEAGGFTGTTIGMYASRYWKMFSPCDSHA